MYNSKASLGRLSEFAKATKNMFLYGDQSSISMPKVYYPAKGEQKNLGKIPSKSENSITTPVTKVTTRQTDEFTQNDLQQAIIWSEILGKPVSKRRERRYYGN